MKRLSLLILLACTACGQMPKMPFSSHDSAAAPKPAQQQVAVASGPSYQYDGQDCNSRAQSRMAMYDRPDTYPISNQERHDAYQALYSSCMREHNWQVAGPVHGPANDASQFAAMSPAAGGNKAATTVTAGNTTISTSSVGGATILVIGGNGSKDISPSQLSSISPSAGGGSATPPATVVMVQSPNQQPAYAQQPAAPLPVAIPVPPPRVAKGHTTAAATPVKAAPVVAQAPKPTMVPAPTQAMYAPVNPNPAPLVHKKLSAPPAQAAAHSEPRQTASVSPTLTAQDLSDRQLENILVK